MARRLAEALWTLGWSIKGVNQGLERRVDVAARFDARADTYDDSAAHRWQAGVAAEVAGVSLGERVLDVATGTGLLLRSLPAFVPEGSRVGLDIAPALLEVAARELPGAHWVLADAGSVPFADGTFDVVTCIAGMSYLRPEVVLPEWRRVVRDSGRVVVSVPADRGLTLFALLQDSARTVGIELSEPNAGLGSHEGVWPIGSDHGLVLRDLVEMTYREPSIPRPEDVFVHYLQQGLAEPLSRAGPELQRAALDTFQDLCGDTHHEVLGQQRLLFITWTVA